jgi:hypothetical protein
VSRVNGRVQPGQNIAAAFSARAWNRAQDAADIVLGDRGSVVADALTTAERAANIVLVRNQSGLVVPRFGVLGINSVEINPTGQPVDSSIALQFAQNPVVTGITPTLAHVERFVVLLEPVEDQKLARAAISGVFACRVFVMDSSHGFATIRADDTTQLESTSCGVLQLLWKEIGTGPNKWALGVM